MNFLVKKFVKIYKKSVDFNYSVCYLRKAVGEIGLTAKIRQNKTKKVN